MAGDSPPPPPPPSPPPQEELPEPKRQKMSTTTTTATTTSEDENPENPTGIPRTPKYKRRKVAIFFAYCGVGYQGMQKNPGAKTIEGDFEEALLLSGAIPEEERGLHRRFDWARSARTDKGVSAVGQVVSGKFYVDPPGFVERLNSHLAPQIRVFGYKRATPRFNAKKFCDRRRYVYMVPVFALDPSCHRDRESVLASAGSGNELVKCVECSERGRKVFGVMGKRSFEPEIDSGISSNKGCALVESEAVVSCSVDNETGTNLSEQSSSVENRSIESPKTEALEQVKEVLVNVEGGCGNVSSESKLSEVVAGEVEMMKEDTMEGDNAARGPANDDHLENGSVESPKLEEVEELSGKGNGNGVSAKLNGESKELLESVAVNVETMKIEKKSEFCYGEAEKERFNRILKYYVGTHNFHNFTTRTKAEDPAAKRYILSFNANTVLNINGMDFIKCEVVGQSFMLHQIRKMIGLAVAIMRNCSPESLIEKAFEQKVNINVPMAPEVGLYLDECFFSSYNQKWKDSHEELSMKAYVEEAEEFKMKYIYSHIAATEQKDGAVAVWLHSLNYRNYPDLRDADTSPITVGSELVENQPSFEVVKDEEMKVAD